MSLSWNGGQLARGENNREEKWCAPCSCRGLLLLIPVIRISPGNVGDVPRDNYSVTVTVGGGTWDNTTDNTFDKTAATRYSPHVKCLDKSR